MCNCKDIELYEYMLVGDEYTLPKKVNGYIYIFNVKAFCYPVCYVFMWNSV